MSNNLNNHYAEVMPDGVVKRRYELLCKQTPTESTSLYNEINFVRLVAEEAMSQYVQADSIVDPKDKLKTKLMAFELINKSFSKIESLSVNSARIDQYNRTSAAVQMARVIIDEAITIAEKTFREFVPRELLSEFARKLRAAFEINDGQGDVGARRRAEADLMLDAMDFATQIEEPEPLSVFSEEENRNVLATTRNQAPEVVKKNGYHKPEY